MSDLAAQRVLECINPDRLARLALELCAIQSYTGETRLATERFIVACAEAGLEVEVYDDFPTTPNVVARLPGLGGGRSLELNAHVDTIPLDHVPARIEHGRLIGRGATDMKGSLAGNLEVARAIRESGTQLKGDLLISTHGLHELPRGHGEDLAARLRRGVHGDAAIVTECGGSELPIIGLGMALFTIEISRDGEITHENATPPGTPHPILAGARLISRFEELSRRYAATSLDALAGVDIGPESIFIGEFHAGDFYNRFPTTCRIVGTRRWSPEKRAAEVGAELQTLCEHVAKETGTTIVLHFEPCREGFRVDPQGDLASAVRRAYREVTGDNLRLSGLRTVADVSLFQSVAGIPALYHGPAGTGHHGDLEAIAIDELVRAARVLALAALDYCGLATAS